MVEIPAKGERWDCLRTGSTARVMSEPVEGYVVWRFKGSMPSLTHVNDWHKRFVRKPATRDGDGGRDG